MTPQEQAAAVIKAATQARCLDHWSTVNDPPCHPSDPEWNGCNLCVRRAGDAAAIRAAVDLVLPEEFGPRWIDPREEVYDYQRQSRVNARAQFRAIADAMEIPPMPDSIPLTPEAAAVMAAFDAVMDRAGVFEGAADALAAALREVADRVAPSDKAEPRNNLPALIECQRIRREIIGIADSIENAITYAPVEGLTDA